MTAIHIIIVDIYLSYFHFWTQTRKQAMTSIKTLSTKVNLSQGPGASSGEAIVAHVLARIFKKYHVFHEDGPCRPTNFGVWSCE